MFTDNRKMSYFCTLTHKEDKSSTKDNMAINMLQYRRELNPSQLNNRLFDYTLTMAPYV